jgi:hypothetical protein
MMKTIHVVVIGVEGIGSALLEPLCRILNYGSKVYRFNKATLLIADPSVTESMAARVRQDFENTELSIQKTAVHEGNVADVIADGTVVFCCVTNLATAKIVSDHCATLKNVTAIRGGCDLSDGLIQVFVRRKGKAVTLPFVNEYHPELANPNDEDGRGPQLVVTHLAVASLMLNTFHAFLIDQLGNYDDVYVDVREQRVRPASRHSHPSVAQR